MAFDSVTAMNLAMCVLIFVIGCLIYLKTKYQVPLCIGIAFGFFAIWNTYTLMSLGGMAEIMVLMRIFGYLSIFYALYLTWNEKSAASRKKK